MKMSCETLSFIIMSTVGLLLLARDSECYFHNTFRNHTCFVQNYYKPTIYFSLIISSGWRWKEDWVKCKCSFLFLFYSDFSHIYVYWKLRAIFPTQISNAILDMNAILARQTGNNLTANDTIMRKRKNTQNQIIVKHMLFHLNGTRYIH